MTRRDFLKTSALIGIGSTLKGMPIRSVGAEELSSKYGWRLNGSGSLR